MDKIDIMIILFLKQLLFANMYIDVVYILFSLFTSLLKKKSILVVDNDKNKD